MKLSSLANLMPLDINGTLNPSDAASIGFILAIGMMIALIGWVIGKFWFMPYLDHQNRCGKQDNSKPAKTKSRKVTTISRQKIAKKD